MISEIGTQVADIARTEGAIQASFGGGNALAGGLAGMSSEAFSQMVDTYLSNNTQLDRNERGAITQWAAALSGSAVGGVIGGTTGAQSGAAVSLDAERYNRQLHPDEVARIQQLSGGDKDKEARLKAAACALVKCSAEFAEGSADYVKAQALEQLGNSDAYASERTLLASQSGNQLIYAMGSYASASLPMFGYTVSDQTGDALSHYGVGTRLGGLVQTTGGELQALGGMAMCTTGVACLAGSYLAASGIDTANAGANSFLSGISQKTSGAYLLEGLGVSPEYSEGIYGLTQVGAAGIGGVGKATATVEIGTKAAGTSANSEKGALIGANFAQNRIKSDRSFSEEGQRVYTELAGRPIKTVDDLAEALKTGVVKPEQLPIDYVDINGTRLILNTRTSTALEQASIPRSHWFGRNQTGVEAYPGKTFDDLAADQLKNNKLPPSGAEQLKSVRP